MNFKEWLLEATLISIAKSMGKDSEYGILSAELRKDPSIYRKDDITGEMLPKPINKNERKVRTNTLKGILDGRIHLPGMTGKRYKYENSSGIWPEGKETSLLVKNINFHDINLLAQYFNQESFIHKNKENPVPMMYFLRGDMKGTAVPAYSMKYGHSSALAPKGNRKEKNWVPDKTDWQGEIEKADLGMKDVMGTAADRYPLNFGNTGVHLSFDWGRGIPYSQKPVFPEDLRKHLGKEGDYLMGFYRQERVGREPSRDAKKRLDAS